MNFIDKLLVTIRIIGKTHIQNQWYDLNGMIRTNLQSQKFINERRVSLLRINCVNTNKIP